MQYYLVAGKVDYHPSNIKDIFSRVFTSKMDLTESQEIKGIEIYIYIYYIYLLL